MPAETPPDPGATTPRSRALRRLPIVRWIARADRGSLRSDVLAGLTVAAMLVPQGMAYAALAGMPPVTGLYASSVPLVVYAVLGTSGQLAVGPVAIVSLLTASTLAPLADGDPGTYVALAGMLALLVGGIQLMLGLLRAGRLTNLLSHPVISGFTSAAAIVIATSQLDKLFGLSIGSPDGWLERIIAIGRALPETNLPTLAIGVVAIAALLAGRRLGSRIPTPLLVVGVAAVAVPLLGLADRGVQVLGHVPGGLPTPSLPMPATDAIVALVPGAIIIALLSYLEGISVARAIAARTRDRIDPDQELIASGAANVASGLFQAFPVAGGFSRTAVNHDAGARSPIASAVTAAAVLLALLALAPLFRTLPQVVLAAVVLVAVSGLVSWKQARHAWHVERTDGIALAVTFAATLLLGVEVGIGVGIAVSLVLSLWRVGRPQVRADAEPGGAVLHVDGVLLPASGIHLLETVERYLDDDAAAGSWLSLDLSGVPSSDLSGVGSLGAIDLACQAAEVELRLTGVRPGLLGPLERAGIARRFAGRLEPLATRQPERAALDETGAADQECTDNPSRSSDHAAGPVPVRR